ncbi:MAG TPA: M48 family metalloprotease [Chitinophagaceae bacterium]
MKKHLLFALSLLIAASSFGQITIRIGRHEAPASWTPSMRSHFASTSEAKFYAQEIIDVVGLKPNFEVMAAQVDNAAAVVYGGKRYVLYNPTFINNLVQRTGNKWAAVSVLAHEIGHHLNGHTVTSGGSQPAIELEADEFSGFVLRKMGASLADAQAAMRVLAAQTASRTHPAQHDRLAYIARGWQTADDQLAGRDVARVPEMRPQAPVATQEPRRSTYPSTRQRTNGGTVLSNRNVIGQVRFNADPNSRYYVTNTMSLVKVAGNRLVTIGKLARLNSRSYPYMIHDGSTQLLVDSRGAILTQRGQQVGVLTAARG